MLLEFERAKSAAVWWRRGFGRSLLEEDLGSGAAALLGEAAAPSRPASSAGELWPAASTTRVVSRRRGLAAARSFPLLAGSEVWLPPP